MAKENLYTEQDKLFLFMAHAPEPNEETLKFNSELDRAKNPHGDSYKPKRRSRLEIIADEKFNYAKAMLERLDKGE